MPWPEDLITLAENAGAGTFNVDLFTSSAAWVPVIASGSAVITETSGGGPERTQNSVVRPAYINVRAQIMCRAESYELAKLKARRLYDAFVGVRNQFINSGWYREINPVQEPFDFGMGDDKQRRCVFNVMAVKRPEVVS